MNDHIEVIHIDRKSENLLSYIKLNKETYAVIDRNTGEILETKEYKLNENRAQNTSGLKRTMKNIRDLINNNFTGANNELFLTLTYRHTDGKPMTDVNKASSDFEHFIKRFRRKCRKFPDIEYIAVLEPQESGAWHWHLLVMFTNWTRDRQIKIDNNAVIEPLWRHGFTKTKALNNNDNIGAYLSAYLTNVEINEQNKDVVFSSVYKSGEEIVIAEKEVKGEAGKKIKKKFIKGGRLHYYPSGTNIYRCSRGIKKPTPQLMIYSEVRETIIGDKVPDFARTIVIEGEINDGGITRTLNTITYEHYNLKRKTKLQTISSQPTS
ncbi:MAG: hypothetical protein N3I35_04850 [Clostridia bacterium]|nr:hypothetical protein [Clostridia bacterium]